MIEVRLDYNDLAKMGAHKPWAELQQLGASHEIIYNSIVMKKLRDAKIPVTGFLSVTGVSAGRLTMFEDQKTKEYVYQWAPPAKATPKEEDPDDL